ncbi:putative inactive receptor kinase [Vitis vinifera]|uniref:Putative inactive receptor kinase n=1 Tax=Vitis vinifera TaxID=29760 RepID=A0A438K9X3_VITVI|nr:putative inactive receptor kinase [Vitis vinifera]
MEHRRLVLLVVFLVIVEMLPAGKSDLAADRTALLGLRKVVSGRTLLWNVSQDSPCLWAGVKCEKNRVVGLRLPGCSLTGKIPAGIIGNLTELRVLSLRMNALEGPLPSDLGSCADLRNLYLFGNAFSGEIPASLFGLTKIVRLNLAANNLSGEISTDFNKLTRLKTLYLQENILSSGGSAFNAGIGILGNSMCGTPLKSCSGGNDIIVPKNDKKHKLSGGAIAGIVIGSVVGFVLILIILFVLCGKKRGKKTSAVDVAAVKHSEVEIQGEKPIGEVENGNGYSVAAAAAAAMTGNGNAKGDMSNGGAKRLVFFGNAARVFDLEDLLRASAEVLGKGTFGTAYKAILEMGTVVAVKRLKDVTISENEFREKIEGVGAMDHEHLVPFGLTIIAGMRSFL